MDRFREVEGLRRTEVFKAETRFLGPRKGVERLFTSSELS